MSDYKRLTTNNLEEYNPKYDFCICCEYYDHKNRVCNKPFGPCANYKRNLETYNRLAELEDKIEDGTLIELPCKVGDKVYMPWLYDDVSDIAELTVKRISVDEKCIDTNLESDVFGYLKKYGFAYLKKYDFGVFMFDEIGTKVFLTKPEAQAKLKKLKENNDG